MIVMKQLFILLFAFGISCQLKGQSNKLPNTCPSDLKLTYHYNGGKVYYSEELTISKDSCVFEKNDHGKWTRNKTRLLAGQFNALYAMLKTNQFDRIEYRKEKKVYDRGGIRIAVEWDEGKKQIEISDSGLSFVKDKWVTEWEAVCKYLSDRFKLR